MATIGNWTQAWTRTDRGSGEGVISSERDLELLQAVVTGRSACALSVTICLA